MMASLAAFAIPVLSIISALFFIMGLKLMGRLRSAARGNILLGLGVAVALVGLAVSGVHFGSQLGTNLVWVGVGAGVVLGLLIGLGSKVEIGVGVGPLLASTGGIAAAAVAIAAFLHDEAWPWPSTFALQGGPRGAALGLAVVAGAAALMLGSFASVGPPAHGSGQPAAVALAASASGWAAAMVGLAMGSPIVATVGGLVATAGWTLAVMVAAALGRKPFDVVFGGDRRGGIDDYSNVKACGPEEAAMVLETARKVVMIPGYGMAVAQAQHALADLAKMLALRGATVVYAIHPSAGLIPGHMNILLDEAKVPAGQLMEWEAANVELADADVALVVGANDVVNPATQNDSHSAVYGMPLVDAGLARTVFVIKRSLRPGAAGVKNALFELPQTNMIFGDSKKVLQAIGSELKVQTPRSAAA
jgi:NAD(P) transhydrogenase subunit beta